MLHSQKIKRGRFYITADPFRRPYSFHPLYLAENQSYVFLVVSFRFLETYCLQDRTLCPISRLDVILHLPAFRKLQL